MLMMMRADKDYTPAEGCSVEELLKCIAADDYDACMAACSENEGGDDNEEPVGNGSIKVTRVGSSTTKEVAYNAVWLDAWSVKLTAGENDTKVSSLTFKHSGLWAADSVSLRLFINGEAASKSYVAMKDTADGVTVKLKPAITIKAGKSETIDVKAYLSGASNETHTIVVSDVTVNWTTSWTPVTLNTLKTTSYGVEGVDTAITTPTSAITAWTTNTLLATVTITPDADAKIQGFRVANDWTTDLDEAVANVKVYYQNEEVGKAVVTADEIIVSNLDIDAEAADDVVFKLKWDAVYMWQTTCSVKLYLDNYAVTATEAHSSQLMPSAVSPTKPDLKIQGVDVTITKTTNGKQTIGGGENGVVMYGAKVEANADFTVTNYTITLSRAAGSADLATGILPTFKKLTLTVDGDTTLLTDVTPSYKSGAELRWTLDDEFDVAVNDPANIRITANIYDEDNSNFVAGEFYFTFGIDAQGIENADGDAMTTFSGVDRKWDSTKIEAADYTLGAATEAAPTNDKLYANADNFELGRWNIDAWTAELSISKITLTNMHTSKVTDLNTVISSAVLWNVDDDKEITNTCKISTTDTTKIECDNIKNFVVAADTDVNVALLVDGASFDLADYNSWNSSLQFNLEVTDGLLGTLSTFTAKNYNCANEYTLWIIAPEIAIVTTSDPAIFKVTITNNDANDITLSGLYVAMKKLKGDDSDYSKLRYGLRAVWSNDALAWTTWAIDWSAYALSYDRGTIKAGKSASAELVIDGDIADPVVQVTITKLVTTTPSQENNYSIKVDNKTN